jgi:hypothetical protein
MQNRAESSAECARSLEDLAEALAECLRYLLGPGSVGFGRFTVSCTRENRGLIRLHVDGGIYSRIVWVDGEGIGIAVVKGEAQGGTSLALGCRRGSVDQGI